MNKLNVIFTMDCEAIDELAAEGGPKDWDFCKRSIIGYCETLLKKNFKATLFIVPYTAEKHSRLLLELEHEGVELGLHYHPQDYGYKDYLGAYDGDQQLAMVSEASNMWAEAIGKKPKSFRGGNMSANDYTFPVLERLGFSQGSLSMPGRNFTRVKANWKGSPMYPYHTNKANRLIEGNMEFMEVPSTVDWESAMWGGLTPLELRIEMVDARAHGFTISKNVERQLKDNYFLPYISVLTHDIFDYSDKSEFRTHVLEGILDELEKCAENANLELNGTTLENFHQIYDSSIKNGGV
jgi:peptidoglycan/xylan/chitin deacetylase (PgdA/CDA1 family)